LIRRASLALLALALAACATSTLDAETKASVRSIHVEPVQLPEKASQVPPQGGAPAGSAARLDQIVTERVKLAQLIRDQARRELERKGYRVSEDAARSDAKVRFIVYHGLGVASGRVENNRGIAMTVNMEVTRTADGKRILFAIANRVGEPAKARVRSAPYAEWFADEALLADQYRVVAEALASQALAGM
jgi:hypothetical protein